MIMSRNSTLTCAAVVALALGTSALAKGIFVPIVPVANSTLTNVFAINDNDVITGSWLDPSNVEHGYVGPLSGSKYKTFDDPNSPSPGTEPRAINDGSYITGFSNSQNGAPSGDIPFERDPKGKITEITKKGTLLNYLVQGINQSNEFAGSYVNSSLAVVGYLGENGKYKSAFKVTGLQNSGYAGRGVDNAGDIVGWYDDATGVQHGLLVSGGTAQKLEPSETNLASSTLEGINDKGMITGWWTDTGGLIHAFTYNMTSKKFTNLKVPGSSTFVQAWGINNKGLVAVGSDAGYYIYCPSAATCPAGEHGNYKSTARPKPQLP